MICPAPTNFRPPTRASKIGKKRDFIQIAKNIIDIDWGKREITVTGKGDKTRVCPLGQKALDALMEYAPHYERKWEKKPDGPAPVFLSMWDSESIRGQFPGPSTNGASRQASNG